MLALVQVAGVSQSSLAIRPPAAPRSPSSSWREMFRSADFRCLFLAEGWSYPPAAWRSRSARTACELCQLGLMVRQMLAVLEPEQTPTAYLGCPAVLYEGKTLSLRQRLSVRYSAGTSTISKPNPATNAGASNGNPANVPKRLHRGSALGKVGSGD